MIGTVYGANQGEYLKQAHELVSHFKYKLKHTRKSGLSEGGIPKALEKCHLDAPDIAHELSNGSPWTVRRTTLKTRDLEDAPDKWEFKVLKEFEKRKAAGEDPKGMEHAEVVEKDGKRTFRYMQAIAISRGCLKCHGKHIRHKVRVQLDSLYPFDQATGYSKGDVRGAYSLSRPMEAKTASK